VCENALFVECPLDAAHDAAHEYRMDYGLYPQRLHSVTQRFQILCLNEQRYIPSTKRLLFASGQKANSSSLLFIRALFPVVGRICIGERTVNQICGAPIQVVVRPRALVVCDSLICERECAVGLLYSNVPMKCATIGQNLIWFDALPKTPDQEQNGCHDFHCS
jgi:hypothetical protein